MDALTAEAIGYTVILGLALDGLLVLRIKYRNDYGTMSDGWLDRHR